MPRSGSSRSRRRADESAQQPVGAPSSGHEAAAVKRRPARLLRRLIQGELGSLRVVFGLAVIWIIFQSQNDRFLSPTNLTNLMLQITAIGLISVGVVLVLLLGEIDLSVGAVSGLCAAVMAVLNVKHGWNRATWRSSPGIVVGPRSALAPGLHLHPVRDPVVRRHAGRPARLAGRAAVGARARPARSTSPTP